MEEKYHEIFDAALKEYNDKQTRSDRKIENYLQHILKGKQEKPFYEAVVQIGNINDCGIGKENCEFAKLMLDEYMKNFESRNPNIKVFNAVMHLDEATPHLHIDFIPVCHSPKRGLPLRVSLKGALLEQGIAGQNLKDSERKYWAGREREELTEILKHYGFDRDDKNIHRPHMTVEQYKQYARELEKYNARIEELKQKPAENFTAQDVSEIKNDNDIIRKENVKLASTLNNVTEKLGADYVAVPVYTDEKIEFMTSELNNIGIPNLAESRCVYVPEYAKKTAEQISDRYTPSKSMGIREEIALDIDRLIYNSENYNGLLENLKQLGYEIKDGKYTAVKSPKAQRFIRLRSLGDAYLPANIEKRIQNKDTLPNAVKSKFQNANEVEKPFYSAISQTVIEIRKMTFKPQKQDARKYYMLTNDRDINSLTAQLMTINTFGLNSRGKLYSTAENLSDTIKHKKEKIQNLLEEISTLQKDIDKIQLYLDGEQQFKTAADKHGISNSEGLDVLKHRLKLLPMYAENLKSELADDEKKLELVSSVVKTYEEIVEGNFIDNLIKAAKEREKQTHDKMY